MAAAEYMYLLFARTRYFDVRVGETSTRIIADTSDAAIGLYFKDHVDPKRYEYDARAEWDAELERFRESTTIDRFEIKRGSLGSRYRVEMTRLTYPSGDSIEVSGTNIDDHIQAAFVNERGSRPGPPQTPFDTWKSSVHPSAELRREWIAVAYAPDGTERQIEIAFGPWPYGAPVAQIVSTLNSFAADGWSLVSTAEDKGLYKGDDAVNESFPARIRFLLSRSTDARP